MGARDNLEEHLKSALDIGRALALELGSAGSFEASGKVSMLCQAIRLVFAELEKNAPAKSTADA